MEFFFNINRGSLASQMPKHPDNARLLTETVSSVAYVTRDVLPGKGGRLHYLATEWAARSMDDSFIAEGTLVRPVSRRGNTWLVAVAEQTPSHQAA